jgi:hypothetical protein
MHPHPHVSQILARQRTHELMGEAGPLRWPRRDKAASAPMAATLPENLTRGETLVVLTVTSEVVVLGRPAA